MKKIIDKITKNADLIGIGTGKTIASLIKELPTNKIYVPTSYHSQLLLRERNLFTTSISGVSKIDCYIDSTDYLDNELNLIKGNGGSILNEKILMRMSAKNYIFVQKYKIVESFETKTVCIVLFPDIISYVTDFLKKRKVGYKLRENTGKSGPIITDNGLVMIDIDFDHNIIQEIKKISGVVETGYISKNDFSYDIIYLDEN